MATKWYTSANDPQVLVNDSFPKVTNKSTGEVYPIRYKSNKNTGSIDAYQTVSGSPDTLLFSWSSATGKPNPSTAGTVIAKQIVESPDFKKVQQTFFDSLTPREKDYLISQNGKYKWNTNSQKDKTPPPTKPGGGNPDTSGGNSEDTGSPAGAMSPLRNVSNFTREEDTYGEWTYPIKMNLNQDYLYIYTHTYEVSDVFGGSGGISNTDSGLIFGGANLSKRTLKKSLGYVRLPMPSNISEANQTGWGEDSLNNLAAGLMGGAVGAVDKIGGGDLVGGAANLVDTAKTLFNSSGAKAQIKQQLTLNAAASVVKKLGVNINAEGYRARVTGTVINPNLELLFNGPKLRAFQFSFKMAPRSADEAKHIRGIIKFFKKSMAPKRAKSGGTGDEFFLGAPNIFRIKFMNGKKESNTLPTLKTCALVNFTVNYTADGFYSAFNDGQPVSVQIDLSFAELTPIYNDNYGSEDSVGFNKSLDDLEDPIFTVKDPSETQNAADQPSAAEQERLADTTGRVPTTPQRPTVSGGQSSASSLGARISNPERYEAARKAGFSGTFQQWLTTQNN